MRDDHAGTRTLQPRQDREVQPVEVVEADVRNQEIRLDAVECFPRRVKRRGGYDGAAGVVQKGLGPEQEVRVGMDKNYERRHAQ